MSKTSVGAIVRWWRLRFFRLHQASFCYFPGFCFGRINSKRGKRSGCIPVQCGGRQLAIPGSLFFQRYNEGPALSLRYAMQSSLVVMAIPNCFILFSFAVLALEPPDGPDGRVLEYFLALQIFILPILGVGGWFFGRWSSPKST